ncbi:MAG: ribosomal protein S18-alanine N-acetyltransferase [Eubacterium sp.]|nr:ribosomal protein S18-alanine N-acetyltransferase [Eubacterium sp.]
MNDFLFEDEYIDDEILIREADISDAADIAEVEVQCFPKPWSEDVIRYDLSENGKARYYVAVDGGHVVGYMSVWVLDYEGFINNVAVIPSYRRRHIASMLIETMLEATEAEGIVSHTLEVRKSNKAARRLYELFDFKETAVRSHYYSDNGEDAIIMWRMGALSE